MDCFHAANRAAGAFALIAAIACNSPNEPFPPDAVAIEPPRPYELWWAVTQACSGINADFAAVRWYMVPNATAINVNGTEYQGYWWPNSKRIVLTREVLLRGPFVRHEMLHALVGTAHSREYFVDRCGGVVTCERDCAAEVGEETLPPADAPEVPASALDLALRIDPAEPSAASDSGWVVITVSVRNPHPYSVWARLAPVADGATASATFGVIVDCDGACTGGTEYAFVEGSRLGFKLGQTRQLAFDRRLQPGAYHVRAFFNVDTTARVPFTVTP